MSRPTMQEEAHEAIRETSYAAQATADRLEEIRDALPSLRDYFAAHALPALIGQYSGGKPWVPESIAGAAYQYADEMLAERAK